MTNPYDVTALLLPDDFVREFALTLAHGLAAAVVGIIISLSPPRPRRKP